MRTRTENNKGFTLIELLIVIGLLGALTALVLPSLSADREEALGDVCDYSQSGTLRVLKQFKQLTGTLPDGMHNGLTGVGGDATAIDGLPEAQSYNMTASDPLDIDGDGQTDDGVFSVTLHSLTAEEAASLQAAGIDYICSGTGLQITDIAEGIFVAQCTDAWYDDTPAQYTFDGIGVADWISGDLDGSGVAGDSASDEESGTIVVLWVAPTINWDSATGDNSDWGHGNVSLGLDLEGQCPIPAAGVNGTDPEFGYYMAYIKAYQGSANPEEATPAKLVGTSCPECGVLNP
jgi:prepilin-type N-terminal cleavage/methylation domain-containing protein